MERPSSYSLSTCMITNKYTCALVHPRSLTYVNERMRDCRLQAKIKKGRASFDKSPVDFSGGPVRSFMVHSIK